jgi:hypothetical protein
MILRRCLNSGTPAVIALLYLHHSPTPKYWSRGYVLLASCLSYALAIKTVAERPSERFVTGNFPEVCFLVCYRHVVSASLCLCVCESSNPFPSTINFGKPETTFPELGMYIRELEAI